MISVTLTRALADFHTRHIPKTECPGSCPMVELIKWSSSIDHHRLREHDIYVKSYVTDCSAVISLATCTFPAYPGDQIKQVEMGGAYGTYGVQVRCIQGFGGETWRKEDAL